MISPIKNASKVVDRSWIVWFGEGTGGDLSRLRELRISGEALDVDSTENWSLRVFGDADEPHSLHASSGPYTAVFFGRLWNRRELNEQLGEVGERLEDDAWIVLAAYRKWGKGLLHRIRGVFSLVILDRDRGSLTCARDPMGIWPLFYAVLRGGVVFSTSIEALLRFPGVPGDVSRASVAMLLSNLNQKKDDTLYQAIRRIPAGHAMHCVSGDRRIDRYWDPVPKSLPRGTIGREELEEFEALVDQAVARCLQRGRAAIYLSGGIDSVTVATMATEICRREGLPPPKAFSLIFPDLQANEEAIQRSVAAELGLEHFIIDIEEAAGPRGLLLPALEISRRLAAPTLTIWLPAYHRLAGEAGNRGCDCILTGGGGDEWMGNSPFLVADQIQSLDFAGIYQLWNTTRNSNDVPPYRLAKALLWSYGLRPLLGSVVARVLSQVAPGILEAKRRFFRSTPDWISQDRELRKEMEDHLEPTVLPSDGGGFYLREVRRFLDHFLVATEMEATFENERLTGLPVLQPLFDPDLLLLLCRVAPELLSAAGQSKSPARQMLAKKFPRLGFDKQKKVQGTNYFRTVMMREGRAGWEALGGIHALSGLGVVDPEKWNLTMQGIMSENEPKGLFRLWSILSVESWLRSRT